MMGGMGNAQGGMNGMAQMMLMQNLLGSGSQQTASVGNVLNNYVNNAKMQQLQSMVAGNNPATCDNTPISNRKTCTAHTGNMIRDLTMCQVKGCCYDAQAWGAIDQLRSTNPISNLFSTGSRTNFGS